MSGCGDGIEVSEPEPEPGIVTVRGCVEGGEAAGLEPGTVTVRG